jgi:hypothetical protein
MVYSSSKMYKEFVKLTSIVNGRFEELTCVDDLVNHSIQIDKYEGNNTCIHGKIQKVSRINSQYGVFVENNFYCFDFMNIANIKFVWGEYV